MTRNEAILEELGQFLKENYPVKNGNRGIFTLSAAEKNKVLNNSIKKFVARARINVEWRTHLGERLNLSEEEVILATNTMIDMIENALVNGGIVRLRHFGDFIPHDMKRGGYTSRTFYFKADRKWLQIVNEPLLKSDLGLKRTLKGGKLARRIEEPQAPVKKPERPRKTFVQTKN